MISGGNNFNDFPENQFTKFRAVYRCWLLWKIIGGSSLAACGSLRLWIRLFQFTFFSSSESANLKVTVLMCLARLKCRPSVRGVDFASDVNVQPSSLAQILHKQQNHVSHKLWWLTELFRYTVYWSILWSLFGLNDVRILLHTVAQLFDLSHTDTGVIINFPYKKSTPCNVAFHKNNS